jgi:N-acetylglucosamine kinase-like BadF-type ATPase
MPDFAMALCRSLTLRALDELVAWSVRASPSEVAGLAHAVCAAADDGDPIAVELVTTAADDLTDLVRALLPRVDIRNPAVALGGGLLEADSPVRAATERRVQELTPGLRVLPGVVDPPLGALRLAESMSYEDDT